MRHRYDNSLSILITIKCSSLSSLDFKPCRCNVEISQRLQHIVFIALWCSITKHNSASPSDLEPAGLFNHFMTEHRKWIVDVGAALGGTFIITVSQRACYILSSKIWIGAKGIKKNQWRAASDKRERKTNLELADIKKNAEWVVFRSKSKQWRTGVRCTLLIDVLW